MRVDRVLEDVPERRVEVPGPADDPGGEAPAEEVSTATMTDVERLRVRAVQPLHAGRQVGDLGGEDDVVVRAHQAVRVERPGMLLARVREHGEEVEPVDVIEEDHRARDAVRRDVERPVGQVPARNSGHVLDGTGGRRRREPRARLSARFRRTAATDPGQTRVCPGSVPACRRPVAARRRARGLM